MSGAKEMCVVNTRSNPWVLAFEKAAGEVWSDLEIVLLRNNGAIVDTNPNKPSRILILRTPIRPARIILQGHGAYTEHEMNPASCWS